MKLQQANRAFSAGDWTEALQEYRAIQEQEPTLAAHAQFNLELVRRRLYPNRPTAERRTPGGTSLSEGEGGYTGSLSNNEEPKSLLFAGHPARPFMLHSEIYSISVIVPVHNALDDVEKCLESLAKYDDGFSLQVYVVNDKSNAETTYFLRSFCIRNNKTFNLIENERNIGYTSSVNEGLRRCRGDLIVTLNSDTIVTRGWLSGMVRCMVSDTNIGVVGPLSNAASWQNVPQLFDGNVFAVNALPQGFSTESMADLVRIASERSYPRVPFVNGFCFMVRRDVLDVVGILDEDTFPTGYGEENDLCLRVADAGYDLAVADDAYVYHAKSKSFGHTQRQELSKRGQVALRTKHGNRRLDRDLKLVKNHPVLPAIRQRVFDALAAPKRTGHIISPFGASIIFCLPVAGGGGGTHSVVQEAWGMSGMGLRVHVGIPPESLENFRRLYPREAERGLFRLVHKNQWSMIADEYDFIIGTVYHSMWRVKEAVEQNPRLRVGYYVQDYEPLFFEAGSDKWNQAKASYHLIRNATLFAKTNWLCNKVWDEEGLLVYKVEASIDHEVYKPSPQRRPRGDSITVAAMVRPETSRRGPERTLRVLADLAREFRNGINLEVFGGSPDHTLFESWAESLPIVNHGPLTREQVAGLLGRSDLFLDLSDYQAFGRTALEAMACGTVAVVPRWGGAGDFADETNSLSVDPFDAELSSLIVDWLRNRDDMAFVSAQLSAMTAAARFTPKRAAYSELQVLARARPYFEIQ